MKLDVLQELTGLDGQPFMMAFPTQGPPVVCDKCKQRVIAQRAMTLRDACVEALMTAYDDERLTGEQKVERASLAELVYKKDVVTVTVKQAALMKDLVDKRFAQPLIVFRAWDMLEGDDGAAMEE